MRGLPGYPRGALADPRGMELIHFVGIGIDIDIARLRVGVAVDARFAAEILAGAVPSVTHGFLEAVPRPLIERFPIRLRETLDRIPFSRVEARIVGESVSIPVRRL